MSDLHRPAHVPSFLVWGGWYGSRNVGDDAILLGLKELIGRVNEGRDLYVRALTTDRDQTSALGVTGERALVKKELFRPWAWLRVLGAFARPDRVIVSGGTPIFDASHAIRTLYLGLPLLLGKPFVVFGAGVKPLRSRWGRGSVPFFLKRAAYVSVRDEDSRRILEALGVEGVELTADSAFFARPAADEEIEGLLASCGIDPDGSLLVVAPRLLSGERKRLYLEESMGPELIREAPARWARAIDRVAHHFDRVVLVAMHYHGPDSDVPVIRETLARLATPKAVFLDRELGAEQAVALFRKARLLLGVRLHALLLAASMGTPVVGLAYEQKVKSLFERLGLEPYCLDLFDFDEERLAGTVERALAEEARVRDHLRRRVEALRELVLASARRALQVGPLPAPDDDGRRG